MAQYVGMPDIKVILKRKQYQWITPPLLDFDINFSSLIGEYSSNVREDNVLIETESSSAIVKPLYVNRNNYIEGSSTQPEPDRFIVDVPKGAPPETQEEIQKRVFIPKPTLYQRTGGVAGDFKHPWEAPTKGYDGPLWSEEAHEPEDSDPSLIRAPYTTWCHQRSSSPNVEWFLHQKHGNFTNQSFWVDIHKYSSVTPEDVDDTEAVGELADRYIRYGKDYDTKAYIAFRIGWTEENPKDIKKAPRNSRDPYTGPYDIVFPIGKSPFIYDHQGDSHQYDQEKPRGDGYYDGFVASKKDDPSWIFMDDYNYARFYFLILRGKLIIYSNYASSSWVFPDDFTAKASSKTGERYSNFYVPAGKVCIMGRGFDFRFSFNPVEFDIYKDGKERKPHGSIIPFPMSERDFGGDYGWRDLTGKSDSTNFAVIPFDRDTTDSRGNDVSFGYGFDVVTDLGKYDSIGYSSYSYTSMMIGVDGTDPQSRTLSDIVDTYFRTPNVNEDTKATTFVSYGFETTLQDGVLFNNKMLQIDMNCKAPTIGPYTHNVSKRFASPVLWRLKGHHNVPPTPVPSELDITNLVKSISYNTSTPDYRSVRQSYTVDVIIPKDYNLSDFGFGKMSRRQLLDWLHGGLKEIEIWLGYWGGGRTEDPAMASLPVPFYDEDVSNKGGRRIKVFTGLSMGGPINETYGQDVISLQCKDKLEILSAYPILNSPFYDGMRLSKAFYHLCTLSGLPKNMFRVRSNWARFRFLPLGYTFQEPRMRFDENTPLIDAIKRITKMFWHVLRTDPDGTIVLTDLYSDYEDKGLYIKTLEELSLTHPSYVFYVDGSLASNPFQRAYEVFTTEKNTMDHITEIDIMSVDRNQGAIIVDGTAMDVGSIENPWAKNFIGFRKPLRYTEPALGDIEHIRNFRENAAKHFFQSPISVKFHTFGRPTLRPLDIIEVRHSEPQPFPGNPYNMKYRVLSVGGTIQISDKWRYQCDIQAEHL